MLGRQLSDNRGFSLRWKLTCRCAPYDLFDVRALLTDEERAVQDAVARFTDTRVIPAIGDAFDAGRFPREWIPELAELGLLGASLPARDGGAGLGAVSYGLICQELERGDSGLRSFVSVQSLLCMYTPSTPMAATNSGSAGCWKWRQAGSSAVSA